jgi:hypothetical protein
LTEDNTELKKACGALSEAATRDRAQIEGLKRKLEESKFREIAREGVRKQVENLDSKAGMNVVRVDRVENNRRERE